MKVIRIEKLEDCFDGSSASFFHFDQAWTRATILQLATMGELNYFPDFPRPFFRLRGASGVQIKGVEGLRHCRVVLQFTRLESFREELEKTLRK